MMKRQRGVKVNAVNPINTIPIDNPPPSKVEEAMGKKKPKKEAEHAAAMAAAAEEVKKENREVQDAGLMQGEENVWNDWEENMPLYFGGGVVDETMPWGYTGFSGWDMDLMENYSDVVLDDDIWNLKTQIPFPVDM